MRRRRRERAAVDVFKERERLNLGTSTLERIRQGDGKFVVNEANVQVVNQSILDTLYHAGKITGRQYEAADRFRADMYNAGMVWSRSSLNGVRQETRKDNRTPGFVEQETGRPFRRWARATKATMPLDRLFGAIMWPRDSGIDAAQVVGKAAEAGLNMEAVKVALDKLADHYGIR